PEVRAHAVAVGDVAPPALAVVRRVDDARVAGPRAVHAGVVAEPVGVPDLVAPLVAHRVVERRHAVAAAQAVDHAAVRVRPGGVAVDALVERAGLHLVHGCAGDAEAGEVHAGRELGLADVLAQVARVHVAGRGARPGRRVDGPGRDDDAV